jgi:hypothetical protein
LLQLCPSIPSIILDWKADEIASTAIVFAT